MPYSSSKIGMGILRIIFSFSLIICSGCDDEQPKVIPKDPLQEISISVYGMKINAWHKQVFDCYTANLYSENDLVTLTKENKISNILLRKDILEAKGKCKFWQATKPLLDAVYSRIIKNGSVPSSMYYFSIFENDLDGGYSKTKIGLFENIHVCNEIEAQYQQIGEGTSRCKEWISDLTSTLD